MAQTSTQLLLRSVHVLFVCIVDYVVHALFNMGRIFQLGTQSPVIFNAVLVLICRNWN